MKFKISPTLTLGIYEAIFFLLLMLATPCFVGYSVGSAIVELTVYSAASVVGVAVFGFLWGKYFSIPYGFVRNRILRRMANVQI